jgi:hypothetical protein
MKQKDIKLFHEDIFHGNAKTGVVLQVQQIIKWLPPFDKLYTKQTNQIVCANVNANLNGTSLVLKPKFCCTGTVLIAGRDITQTVLECTMWQDALVFR